MQAQSHEAATPVQSTETPHDETHSGHDATRHALEQGRRFLASLQHEGGHWEGEVVWNTMITSQYVMVSHLIGRELPEDKHTGCQKYFDVWQMEEGCWGMHADSTKGSLFVTAMVYTALRLLGRPPEHPQMVKAREWLHARGGVTAIPTWGKVWLSLFNLYKWEGVNPILPELWLLPDSNPVHPRRYYCHTRLIYLAIGVLYAQRFQRPEDDWTHALRSELYIHPYDKIHFSGLRHALHDEDIFAWPTKFTKIGYEVSRFVDWIAPKALRRKAIDHCIERIRFECRSTRHTSISPVNGLLNILALWLENPEDEDLWKTYEKLDYWMWMDDTEGCRYTGARSQSWDTSFTVQAFCAGPNPEEWKDTLQNALHYFDEHQIQRENLEYEKWYRLPALGGFCFSDREHRWPVSDCTAEALEALHNIQEHLGHTLPLERIEQAAQFLLYRQNPEGGWGSYEERRGNWFLEQLNPSEMYGNCMLEHSYIECTSSCIHGLRAFLDMAPDADPALRKKVEAAIPRGEAFLRKAQNEDGSWSGFWGVTYTYGTFFGIQGLRRAGASADDPAIRKAVEWLKRTQLSDGGWGEDWESLLYDRYIPSEESQVIQTSWSLMALLLAEESDPALLGPAARLLAQRQDEEGNWAEEGVGGSFFNTAMHHYRLYKNYFPVWALGMYEKARLENA